MSSRIPIGLALACALGCANDVAGTGGIGMTVGTTSDAEGSSTSGTTSVATTGDGAATGSSSSDEGVIYDVGTQPDLGDETIGDCADASRAVGSAGCRFWAVDLPNSREASPGGDAEAQQFAVVVANNSSRAPANVVVFIGDEAVEIDAAEIAPLDTHTFELPEASIDPTWTSIDGVAFRIESDVPVTAYQFNPLQNSGVYSNDATVLWPEHALGDDHLAVTEDATAVAPSWISIVATADDTEVEVFPTTDLSIDGPPSATLDRGDVFTVISRLGPDDPNLHGNLSGSRIISSAPVSVFSGNVSAPVIPTGGPWEGGSRVCCADHLEHQLTPLVAWGTAYAIATVAPAYYDVDPSRYRIVGAFDDTPLVYDPVAPIGAPTSIDAGETVRFDTDASFTVASGDPSKPFSIAQFLPSGDTTDSIFDDERRGDPAMIILPPVEQFQSRYVVALPQAYAIHRMTIASAVGATIDVDGVAVAGLLPLGSVSGVDWVYAHVDVGEGTHVVSGSEPFELSIAGYDVEVSYGFAAGSGLGAISTPPPPPG